MSDAPFMYSIATGGKTRQSQADARPNMSKTYNTYVFLISIYDICTVLYLIFLFVREVRVPIRIFGSHQTLAARPGFATAEVARPCHSGPAGRQLRSVDG